MDHMDLEVVGLEETRPVDSVKADDGNVIDLIPRQIQRWLIVSARPNGETIRAQVSDEDWKRVIEPALAAAKNGTAFVR